MWAEESVIYQIYPLGMCGAPFENPAAPGEPLSEEASANGHGAILQVLDWIPHLEKLHVGTVLFNPLFESDTHGYNTRDFFRVDRRLGTNGDFKKVCEGLHEAGIHVMLDGVFNHVGRGFFAFQDVLQKKWDSPYKDWFHINFDGNDAWNDGLWYEGWEGNYDLVKLNLNNEAVVNHLLDAVRFWVGEFGIDGLRLDVAYCLDRGFLRRLRAFTDSLTAELGREEPFFLFGEILGGDYKTIMAPDMLHSATNYECCKGLYSSFNSSNLFEINHSLIRQFGSDPWCLYRGMHLISFADNHDITRVASVLNNPAHLPLLYALMFGMPGIPCIYYGSEWGMKGEKRDGDPALRPAVREPEWNELTDFIAQLAAVKRESEALCYGEFRSVLLTNKQCIFERRSEHERVLVAINMDDADYTAHFDAGCGMAVDLISGRNHDFGGGSVLPACSAQWWRMER